MKQRLAAVGVLRGWKNSVGGHSMSGSYTNGIAYMSCPLLESLPCLTALVAVGLGQGLAQRLSALHAGQPEAGRLEPCMLVGFLFGGVCVCLLFVVFFPFFFFFSASNRCGSGGEH